MGNVAPNNNIDLHFNKEENILYWELNGIIDNDYLVKIMDDIASFSNTIKDLRIIEIEGKYNLKINVKILPSIIKRGYRILKQFDSIKHAGVINTPRNVAFFTILSNSISSKSLKTKVFSEFDNAKNWINKI